MKKSGKILIFLIIFLLAIYLVGYFYYQDKFLPNTFLNNKNVSNQNIAEITDKYIEERNNKTYKISGNYGEEVVIKLSNIEGSIIDEIKVEQNLKKWPLIIFNKKEIKPHEELKYNEKLILAEINNSEFAVKKPEPKDAHIVWEKGAAVIKKETEGRNVDLKKLQAFIIDTIESDKTEANYSEYIDAKVKEKDLVEKKKNYDKLHNRVAKIKVGEDITEIPLRKFYTDLDKLHEDGIREEVRQLAIKTDTFSAKRPFKTINGKDITVPPGTYGWQMNVQKTFDKLMVAIKDNKDLEIEPVYNIEANTRKNNDLGNEYLEIDLSKQTLWHVRDDKALRKVNVVTGAPGSYTPTGVHAIKDRARNRYLKGVNRISKNAYESFVKYWMPVDWQGVGIHDASWQNGNFSSKKYLNGWGSNGCINVSEKDAKYIFDNLKLYTPVVIYESSTNYSKNYIP